MTMTKELIAVFGILVAITCTYYFGYRSGENSMELFYQKRIGELDDEADKRLEKAQAEAIQATDNYFNALSNEQEKIGELNETKRRLRLEKRNRCAKHDGSDMPDFTLYRMYNAAASTDDLQASEHFQTPDAAGDGLDAVQAAISSAIDAKLHANALLDVLRAAETNGCVRVID